MWRLWSLIYRTEHRARKLLTGGREHLGLEVAPPHEPRHAQPYYGSSADLWFVLFVAFFTPTLMSCLGLDLALLQLFWAVLAGMSMGFALRLGLALRSQQNAEMDRHFPEENQNEHIQRRE